MAIARWLDVFYPPACFFCRDPLRRGCYLCDSCRNRIPRLEQPFCIQCGEHFEGVLPEDVLCSQCRGRPFMFEFARAAAEARDEGRDLMHAYKYGRQLHLHRELALLASEAWSDLRLSTQSDPPWTLVPVPLHWRRQHWRWFNQSHEIAKTLGRLRGLPVRNALRRIRNTNQQTLLSRTERLANLRGAFRLSRRELRRQSVRDQPILLVDDVFTTGSTAEECARILLEKGGAEKVVVLTVLRG